MAETKLNPRMGMLEALEAVNKKYGSDTITRISDASVPGVRWLSSGILSLDVGLSGGLPRGRLSLLLGEFSSGKTSLTIKVIKEAQDTCRHCSGRLSVHLWLPSCSCKKPMPMMTVFMDAEGTFDKTYAQQFGIDLSQMFIITPEYAEQGIDIADKVLRSGECDLFILDSVAELTPAIEITASAEDLQMGVHARLMNKFMRKFKAAVNSFGTSSLRPTMLAINQPRQKIGVVYGSPETYPGGKGIPLAASVIVNLKQAEKLKDEMNNTWGQKCDFDIRKNKVGPSWRSGSYRIWVTTNHDGTKFPGVVDLSFQAVHLAKWWGLVEAKGAWLSYKTKEGKVITAQGEEKFVKEIAHDEALIKSLIKDVWELERKGVRQT